MTWVLTATGHAATPDGETTCHRVETELLAELHAVLSKPKYGAAASLLRGLHVVSTDLHAAAAAGTPEDVSAPAADGATAPARRGKTAATAPSGGA